MIEADLIYLNSVFKNVTRLLILSDDKNDLTTKQEMLRQHYILFVQHITIVDTSGGVYLNDEMTTEKA